MTMDNFFQRGDFIPRLGLEQLPPGTVDMEVLPSLERTVHQKYIQHMRMKSRKICLSLKEEQSVYLVVTTQCPSVLFQIFSLSRTIYLLHLK